MAPTIWQVATNKSLLVASSILGLGILIAGGLIGWSRLAYRECLKTWPSDQQKAVVERYRLTKEDFCEKGYTLSNYFSLRENIAEKIRSSEDYLIKTPETERTKYFNSEFKSRMRKIIKPDKREREALESPI